MMTASQPQKQQQRQQQEQQQPSRRHGDRFARALRWSVAAAIASLAGCAAPPPAATDTAAAPTPASTDSAASRPPPGASGPSSDRSERACCAACIFIAVRLTCGPLCAAEL